jgi:hypothetical protein
VFFIEFGVIRFFGNDSHLPPIPKTSYPFSSGVLGFCDFQNQIFSSSLTFPHVCVRGHELGGDSAQ